MKQLFTTCLFFIAVHFTSAQTVIQNGGLENWENLGSATEEPLNWNSNKTGDNNASSSFAPQTCFRDVNPHSGTYCAKIVTGTAQIVGTVVNGSLTTGQIDAPTTNKQDGYIFTDSTRAGKYMYFSGRPDSFIGWYKFSPQGGDAARISAFLHDGKYATPDNGYLGGTAQNKIAEAVFITPTTAVGTWTRFAIPFTYANGRTPRFILIAATSSANQLGGTKNSTFWLDDIEVFYQPAVTVNAITPTTYYVSSTAGSAISVPFTLLGNFVAGNTVTAQLSDASGSFTSPTVIGSTAATASGTISATIPAGTLAGTGYRVRVVTSTPALISADNGVNLTVINVSNSIAPTATQNIAAGQNGTLLTVTETAGATTRAWQYASTSGGPYTAVSPAQTGTTYTPNFSVGGTYYVVCVTTYPGGAKATSNEVQVNVIGNSIAPPAPQNLSVNVAGTTLTVTETAPATTRVWKYSAVSGGPYQLFSPSQTGTTYTPLFATSGTFFVICESVINGSTVKSNEVVITVTSPFLITGNITGSPFEFSGTSPNANVNVPYSTTSAVFAYNNIFSAQLSDATGSFSSPTVIGTRADSVSGVISAIIPSTTPAGIAYRIRVVGSNQAITGSNNGVDLIVDQFHNSISPTADQTILYSTNGTPLAVSASQTSTHQWKYSTVSGGPYQSFSPAVTGASYTPIFAIPGTYYVVSESKNQYLDIVTSNEVKIIVTNGSILTTSIVAGSPYLVSPKANVQIQVPFTSDVVFDTSNIFEAYLSDETGSFAGTPVKIGQVKSNVIQPFTAQIPNNANAGTLYKIRVVSTNPAIVGTPCTNDLTIIPFTNAIAPIDTQRIVINQAGTSISVTESHTASSEWKWTTLSGLAYKSFSPMQTGKSFAPSFSAAKTYYVICQSINAVDDTVKSNQVVVIVSLGTAINGTGEQVISKIYESAGQLMIETNMQLTAENNLFELYNMVGQTVISQRITNEKTNININGLPAGTYVFRFADSTGKINLR
ncbi:MAG: PCMD domain-containing protein [Chitinophagales bacterium]|nr:PCMD domain-containing protein [Chitinophagales bacterium]